DRRPARHDSHVECRLWRRRHLDIREARDGGRHGVGGIDQAERAVAVPAGPLERDPVALAADPAARDAALLAAVDGDDLFDPILVLALAEQILHATQVAFAFLADV